jgi:hypothetical protein
MSDNIILKPNEIDAWGEKIFRNWTNRYFEIFTVAGKIDKDLYSPVHLYSGYVYKKINEQLRNADHDNDMYDDHSKEIMLLKLALVSAPVLPKGMTIYRWVTPDVLDEIITRYEEGDSPYCEKGFMSTTLDPSIVEHSDVINHNFKLLKITVPDDTHAIYTDLIQNRSEKELILLPDCYLRYTGIKNTNEYFGYEQYEVDLIHFHPHMYPHTKDSSRIL